MVAVTFQPLSWEMIWSKEASWSAGTMLAASDCGVAAEAAVGTMAAPIAVMPTAAVSRAADLRMRVEITGMWEFDLNRGGASPRGSAGPGGPAGGSGHGAVTNGDRLTGVAAADRTAAAAGD